MDEKKIRDFVGHYESMNEGALARIHDKQNDLIDEARVALAEVASRRAIDFELISEEVKKENVERSRKAKIVSDKKQAREKRITKIALIVAIPFLIVGILIQPDTTFRIVVAVIIQGVVIYFIIRLFVVIKRFFKRS